MAERFLKIEVTKEMYSEVYVRVDDEDPRFRDLFEENGQLKKRGAILEHENVQTAAEETLNDHLLDWEMDFNIRQGITLEVPKEEAVRYKTWDAVNDAVYRKE
jgi:hypothetical protein